MRAAWIRASNRSARRSPAPGKRCKSCAVTARGQRTFARWYGLTSVSWSAMATAWKPAATGPAAGCSTITIWIRRPGAAMSTRRCNRSDQSGLGGRAGWRDGCRARPGVARRNAAEAVGHGLEGDFNRKETSTFSGLVGERVAAKGVTVIDDGTLPDRRGSLTIDDEGTASQRNVLIEDGILVGYMQDRQNARLMGVPATGNGRRQSHRHHPMPRMTNTFMAAGAHDPEEILKSVKNGLYAVNFGGGQVDIVSGKFVFGERGLFNRGRQNRPGGQGRDANRQRPRRDEAHFDDRQRPGPRRRHRHLRQRWPRCAGRRRPTDFAHRRADGRRHSGLSAAAARFSQGRRRDPASAPGRRSSPWPCRWPTRRCHNRPDTSPAGQPEGWRRNGESAC